MEATGEKYEIQVNPNTGAVVKIESERKSASNARSTTLTDEAVASAVEAAIPGPKSFARMSRSTMATTRLRSLS